jgi:hypothetical protein
MKGKPWMAACWKKLSGSEAGSALIAVMAWMYRSCREEEKEGGEGRDAVNVKCNWHPM